MSGIFSCREFWSLQEGADGDDVFDINSLAVVPIPSLDAECIVVGSIGAALRVYLPEAGGAASKHTLLESTLKEPILAIAKGPFKVIDPDGYRPDGTASFGVLHPKALVLYDVKAHISDYALSFDEQGAQTQSLRTELVELARYALDHGSSANLTHGPFRAHKGDPSNAFCVQSMDGALSFIEQGRVGFQRFLPDCLLPGPVCFVASSASIVTCSSSCHIEAYKYLTLASAADTGKMSAEDRKAADSKAGKKVGSDWALSIGETAVEIRFVPAALPTILVLGERSLFWIKDNGELYATKRLEMDPACFLPYRHDGENIDVLVGTHTKQLVVLRNTQVMWSALLDFIPVSLQIGTFGDVRGMITALEDTGRLGCYYLGTDPNMPIHNAVDGRDVDYDLMDEEMREFQAVIKDTVFAEKALDAGGQLEFEHTSIAVLKLDDEFSEVRFQISLTCADSLDNVTVQVLATAPLVIQENDHKAASIGVVPLSIDVVGVCARNRMVYVPDVVVNATYRLGSELRVVSHRITLPLTTFCTPVEPDGKALPMQYTIAAQQAATIADVLGQEFPGLDPGHSMVQFELCDGSSVTIESPQGSGAFRIAGHELGSMWLLAQAVCKGLKAHFRGKEIELKLVGTHEDDDATKKSGNLGALRAGQTNMLLMEEYFEVLDERFQRRTEVDVVCKELAAQAKQIQAIQKQLLIRFRDKTPTPIKHLDDLMVNAHERLMVLSEHAVTAKERVAAMSSRLAAATLGLLLLAKLSFKLNKDADELLEAAFGPYSVHAADQGWEERTDAALLALLKRSLTNKVQDLNITTAFSAPGDTVKLKQHVAKLCAKLGDGLQV